MHVKVFILYHSFTLYYHLIDPNIFIIDVVQWTNWKSWVWILHHIMNTTNEQVSIQKA